MAATLLLSGCIEPDLHLAAESDNRLHVELVTDTSLHTPYTVGIDIEEAGIVYDCDADSERVTSVVVTLRPLVYCLRMEIMKNKLSYIILLTAVGMSSCSSEDSTAVNPDIPEDKAEAVG